MTTGGETPDSPPPCVHVDRRMATNNKAWVWVCEPCVQMVRTLIRETRDSRGL